MTSSAEPHTIPAELAYSALGGFATWATSAAVLTNIEDIASWHLACGGTAATALAMAGVAARLKIDRHTPRGFKKFCAFFTGLVGAADTTWLTWSQATGHPTTPVSLLWLAGGTFATWFISSVIRHRLDFYRDTPLRVAVEQRAAEDRSFWDHVLFNAGFKTGVEVQGRPTDTGDATVLTISAAPHAIAGLVAVDAGHRIAIAANQLDPRSFKLGDDDVKVYPGSKAGEVIVSIEARDLLADEIPFDLDTTPVDICDDFEVGRFATGGPAVINLFRKHVEIIGMSQAGKSTLLTVILKQIFRAPNAAAWIGGTWKLADLVGQWIDGIAHGQNPPMDFLAATQIDVLEMLASLYEEAERRLSIPKGQRPPKPTADFPLLFGILDEAHHPLTNPEKVLCHDGLWRNASELVDLLVRGATGAFVQIILATQRGTNPDYGSHGGSIKTNIGLRFALATEDPNDIYRVLPGVTAATARANKLVHPGTFYMKLGTVQPVLGKAQFARSIYIPQLAAAVQHTAGRMPEEAGRQLTVGQRWKEVEGHAPVLLQESAWARRWHGGDADAFLAYVYRRKAATPPTPAAPAIATAVTEVAAEEISTVFEDAIAKFQQRMTGVQHEKLRTMPGEQVDEVFAALTAAEFLPVPEPLRTLVERFGDREFVSTDDLAKAVRMEPAALGLLLSREPFSITRDSKAVRRPEYDGKPTRGFFMAALLAAAEEFRTGKRSAS